MICLEKLLAENKNVSDWRIITATTLSTELFFVHRALETVRATDTKTVSVTVYADHDGKKGDSAFSVFESDTEELIREKIEKAASRALLVFNQDYQLPENEVLDSELESDLAEYPQMELAKKIADATFAADAYKDGSLNATEIFVYKKILSVKNSRGIDKREVKYSAMIEAIPTWNSESESVELYERHDFATLDESEITREIDKKMQEVRDRCRAEKPASELSLPVVITGNELSGLFRELIFSLNFSSVYSHTNVFSKGDKIQKAPVGDKITVAVCGALAGSHASALFDEDGVTLSERVIVDGGKAVAYFGGTRFAQYLGEKPTGNARCIKVKVGTLTEGELQSAPYIECVSMSGIQLDLYNDYIGGEIRLAYLVEGSVKTPITGISMSGSLSSVLESIRFSDNEVTKGAYCGPEKALLSGMTIL